MPDVSGQDEATARATLVGAGFQVTSTPTSSDSVDVGKVIGTNPAAGTPLPRNTAVSLLVSTGPDLVTVPSTVGQTRAPPRRSCTTASGSGCRRPS